MQTSEWKSSVVRVLADVALGEEIGKDCELYTGTPSLGVTQHQ